MRNRWKLSLIGIVLLLALQPAALGGVSAQGGGFLPADAPVITAANAAQLGRIATLGRGWIGDLAWTPDGSAVIAAAQTGVWRYAPGEPPPDTPLYPYAGRILSATGRYVVDQQEKMLSLLNVEDGSTAMLPNGFQDRADVAFSADDSLMALTNLATGEVYLWSLPERGFLRTFPLNLGSLFDGVVSISPDERLLAAANSVERTTRAQGQSNFVDQVAVWDIQTGEEVARFSSDGQDTLLTHTQFSPDSRRLAVARIGGITVYDIETGAVQRLNLPPLAAGQQQLGDFRVFDSAAFTQDGTRIVGAWTDTQPGSNLRSMLTMWDIASGRIVAESEPLAGYMRGLAADPAGERVAVYNYSGGIHVWAMDGGAMQVIAEDHPAGAELLAVKPDGSALAVGGFDRAVRLWSMETGELNETIYAHSRETEAIAFNAQGLLASASFFDTWVLQDGEVRAIDFRTSETRALSFVGNTLRRLVGGSRFPARLETTDITTDQISSAELAIATAAAFTPDGQRLALVTDQGEVVIYELEPTVQAVTRFQPESAAATLAFTPDGESLLLGTAEPGRASLALYTARDGQYTRAWQTEDAGVVWSVAFSPDGRLVVTGNQRGALVIRNVATGQTVAEHMASSMRIYGVTFSPDGRFLFAATETTVQIWAAADRTF